MHTTNIKHVLLTAALISSASLSCSALADEKLLYTDIRSKIESISVNDEYISIYVSGVPEFCTTTYHPEDEIHMGWAKLIGIPNATTHALTAYSADLTVTFHFVESYSGSERCVVSKFGYQRDRRQ